MIELNIPEDIEKISSLKIGDYVLLSGDLYTARDQAHKRIINTIKKQETMPIDLKNKIIFYAGPAPLKKGSKSSAIGPTTSYRMDGYTEKMLENGVRGFIGKGKRSKEVLESIKKHKSVYFITIGGIAAYLSSKIDSMNIVAYEDLGPEAIYHLKVKDFPCIVAVDSNGNDIFNR